MIFAKILVVVLLAMPLIDAATYKRADRNKRAGGKILKNIKCAGQNRRTGGNFFSKSINLQTKI